MLEELKEDEIISDGIDEEPSLVSEESHTSDDIKDSDGEVSKGSRFVLHLDGMKSAKEQQQPVAREDDVQEQSSNIDNIPSIDNNKSEGLRRRHQSTTTTQDDNTAKKSNKWTELDATSSNNNDEEERLHQQQYTDPLNLFGIPPPALRVAQAKSRSAISYYVEVANLAREIIRITNDGE